MLVIRRLFGTGTNCIAPSGLPLLLSLFPGLAPWAFLSRPCGASFAPETRLSLVRDGSLCQPLEQGFGVQALAELQTVSFVFFANPFSAETSQQNQYLVRL